MWECPFGSLRVSVLPKKSVLRNALPVKRHRGEPGHTRDTRVHGPHSLAHSYTRRTSQPSRIRPSQPINKPINAPARPRDDRGIRGRLNSRSPGRRTPGADRSPRPIPVLRVCTRSNSWDGMAIYNASVRVTTMSRILSRAFSQKGTGVFLPVLYVQKDVALNS